MFEKWERHTRDRVLLACLFQRQQRDAGGKATKIYELK